MAEKKFTPEQLCAIETRDKTLLVSAAAGSGKTATLTERIIRSLTDENDPRDISKMLIVTFTNAAVNELRERITSALKKKLSENPDNKRLEHQLYMLPNAKISTIDSFCNDILKGNAERFGIAPSYRIIDPAEAQILAHSVLSSLIYAVYNGDIKSINPKDFEELSACLVGVKNDSALEEVFSTLYEKSKSHERGVGTYREFAEKIKDYIDTPPEKNPYGEYAIKKAKELAEHYRELYSKMLSRVSEVSPADGDYLDFFEKERLFFSKILEENTYEGVKNALSYEMPSLPRVKKKRAFHLSFSYMRDNMKDAVKNCRDRYFLYSVDEWKTHLQDLHQLISTLSCFIEEFDAHYFEEKRRKGALEYSDIERLAYLSLYDGDGNLTELAYAQREQYSDVYVDEYQDVNAIQNKIIVAVSKPHNRFMVGDVKQSIYGFRSARPDIFAKMKDRFPAFEESDGSDSASIFMSKNFRSDSGIINFANSIFHPLFSMKRESIGYVDEERLEYGKVDTGPGAILASQRTPDVYLFTNHDKDEDGKLGDLAPAWVAEKIANLLKNQKLNSGEQVKPSDIAIILRKDGGRAKIYKDALERHGIKAKTPDSKSFLENSEVQLTLCLLNSIDNPLRDIYLAGLMLSPLYNFTPDEVYLIRKFGGGESLWGSLKKYVTDNEDFIKGKSFIETVSHYRLIAEGVKVDELILRLYNETGLLALASKNGGKENLMLLYNYARKFEASSFEGLFSFINYINKLIESGAGFSAPKDSADESAVAIITAHKSKGLEFPIVFVADAATSLHSVKDRQSRIALTDGFGIAMRTRAPGGLSLVESPVYNAILDYAADKSLEEELRVYYVALTRAREMLYVVGALNAKDKYTCIEEAKGRKVHISPYTLTEVKSFAEIILLSDTLAKIRWNEDIVKRDNEDVCSDFDEDTGAVIELPDIPSDGVGNLDEDGNGFASECPVSSDALEKTAYPLDSQEELYKALTQRFAYKYPNEELTNLPEKMSISKLHPAVLDGIEETVRLSIDGVAQATDAPIAKLPQFIQGGNDYESALRGIATHNFLQFFDIELFKKGEAARELRRLVAEKFLSQKDAERVRLDEIGAFADSTLLEKMRNAKKLYREFRFNVMLPASLFTQDEEKQSALSDREILLQGVIDCLIEDNDGALHLIDYKTDRLSGAELRDKSLAHKKLYEKHHLQLTYYSYAVEKIFKKKPQTVSVYSLALGDTVEFSIS